MPNYPADVNDTVVYTGADIYLPKDSSLTVFEDSRMFLFGEFYLNGQPLLTGISSSEGNEVYVGPTQPTDPAILLWWDINAGSYGALKVKVGGSWKLTDNAQTDIDLDEVSVGTATPVGSNWQIWVDTNSWLLKAKDPQGNWASISGTGIYLGPEPPLDTRVLWGDTDEVAIAGIPGPVGPQGPPGTTVGVFYVGDFGAVGDGITNDTNAIRAAITAAGVNGTIVFGCKSYLLGTAAPYHALLSPLSGQTWIGNGARLTAPTTYVGPQLVKIDNVNNVKISGFTFTCPVVTDAVGIQLSRCNGVDISENRFNSPQSGGVHGKGDVVNLRVTNNMFRGGFYCILMTDPAITEVTGSSDWLISENIVDGLNEVCSGICLNRPAVAARRITVSNNVVRDCAKTDPAVRGYGIALANCGDATITGNTTTNCGLAGIHVEDAEGQFVTITGNTATNCQHAGIFIQSDIAVGSPDYVTIVGNTVRGCCITPTVNLGKGGIEVNFFTGGSGDPPRQVVISNNLSSANNTGSGIYLYATHFSIVESNICTDSNGGVGIDIDSCTFLSISGNICTDTRGTKQQTHGLRMVGSAVATHVGNNIFNGNLTGHTNISSTDNTMINSPAGQQLNIGAAANILSFFSGTGSTKRTVSGAKGSNAALASLLTALAAYGIITDSSTA
jgi:parallel beta-helix repeat protein